MQHEEQDGEDPRRALGARGEACAAACLESRGWTIEAANWRFAGGELDLVASRPHGDGELVIFVEVKTRAWGARVRPEGSVTARKRRQIASLAKAYLRARGGARVSARFDVVAVDVRRGGGRARVRHLPGAFDAEGRLR